MRIIGLDIHRVFAEAVALEDGTYRRLGRVSMTRDDLVAFAATLRPADHVIVEATGNAMAMLEILAPKVARSGGQPLPSASDRESQDQD